MLLSLEQISTLQLWKTPHQRGWMFYEGTVTHGKPTKEQVYPEGLQPKGSILLEQERSVWRNCYRLATFPIHPAVG